MKLHSQLEKASGMMEETSQGKQWRKPNLVLDIPTRAFDVSPQELVQINMPPTPTPTPTPKRVNFLLTPGPCDSLLNESSEASSMKGKPSIRSILPKLSFKHWGSNSDVDKAANIDSCSSTVTTQDKASISRSWSLSKMFTPRIRRTSSLPVPEVPNQNLDSVGSINSHLTVEVSS